MLCRITCETTTAKEIRKNRELLKPATGCSRTPLSVGAICIYYKSWNVWVATTKETGRYLPLPIILQCPEHTSTFWANTTFWMKNWKIPSVSNTPKKAAWSGHENGSCRISLKQYTLPVYGNLHTTFGTFMGLDPLCSKRNYVLKRKI